MVEKKKKKRSRKKARLNVVLDAELKRFAQRYAARNCTQLTQIIVDHFLELRRREEDLDVEQI